MVYFCKLVACCSSSGSGWFIGVFEREFAADSPVSGWQSKAASVSPLVALSYVCCDRQLSVAAWQGCLLHHCLGVEVRCVSNLHVLLDTAAAGDRPVLGGCI